MKKAKYLLIGFILLITGGGLFFLSREEVRKETPGNISFRMLLNKAHIVGRHNGKLQWELEADKTEKSSDERFTYLYGIKKGIFYEWEEGKLYFEAEKASYDNLTKRLQLEDVHIWYKDINARAPVLVWDGEKGLIICEKGADFQIQKSSLKGNYIEVDLRNSSILVNKGILKTKVGGIL